MTPPSADTWRLRHVFGPVPSRRLGRSLGIDLVPPKTCTLDCVYCQVHRTTDKRAERELFFPVTEVLDEVRVALARERAMDVVTLSGSGEPTLYLGMGDLLQGLGALTAAPRVVLTNGTLLWRSDVQADLMHADVVMPSLDAATDDVFERLNRPAPGIRLADHLEGLRRFSWQFPGRLWLEIMLAEGLNDDDAHLDALAALLSQIRADRVQVNTVVRTPTERGLARPLSPARMEQARARFARVHPLVEVIGVFEREVGQCAVDADELLDLLRRRPCRTRELAEALSAAPAAAEQALARLRERGLVSTDRGGYHSAVE